VPRAEGQQGCYEVGTLPRPVIATRQIPPEGRLRVADWSDELSDLASTSPSYILCHDLEPETRCSA